MSPETAGRNLPETLMAVILRDQNISVMVCLSVHLLPVPPNCKFNPQSLALMILIWLFRGRITAMLFLL